MKQKIWAILSCMGLAFLFGWWLWGAFRIQQNKLCSELSFIFTDVLQEEKALRIGRVIGEYNLESSPNKISGAEKNEWCDQDFLFYCDSARTLLDSLFRTTLLEYGIETKTAIRSIREGRVIDSCSDSTFYKEAHPLKQVVYRIDENPNRNIMLQAYVKFPFGTVWRHSSLMWGISSLGLLLLGVVVGGYRFWYKKMKLQEQQQEQERLELRQQQELQRLEAQQQQELKRQQEQQRQELLQLQEKLQQQQQELQEKEKQLPSLLIQNKTIKWIELSKDLFFDEEHGDLCYRDEVNIRLTENLLRLFCLFITVEQRKLTWEKICVDVLARLIKNGVSKSDRDVVANVIRHLRVHLEPIPVIQIETIRGVGYQMIISDSYTSQEDYSRK